MSTKTLFRLKMALYGAVLLLAELLQTAVFGGLPLGLVPCVMPLAVVCIALFEGGEKGCIFGLAGGCLWAWGTSLSRYGAICIVLLCVIGTATGLITERYLLRGLPTALCAGAVALFLTDGLFVIEEVISGHIPGKAFFTLFIPECLLSLALGLLFYAITAQISRIGGSHG